MVWALCWKSACGNRSRCKDLLQEVSITLWIHFDELRPDAVLQEEKAWVRWWTRSVLDLQRRKERPSLLPLTAMLADTVAADDLLAQKEEMEHLMAALSPTEQELVRLHIEGYRPKEIATIMGLSCEVVYQRLHRTLGKARKALLVAVLLLVATTVAIAVVPQWRQWFFGSVEPAAEDTVPVNVISPVSTVVKEDIDSVPLLKLPPELEAREDLPPDEHINFLSMPLISFDEAPILPSDRKLLPATIAITGSILTVSGLDGEWVVFYDKYGRVVSSKRCRGMCTFEIPSKLGRFYGIYQYNLPVGDTLWIKMRI